MTRGPSRVLELRSVRGTGGGPDKTILLGAERHDASRYAVTVCYLRDLRDPVFRLDERARLNGLDYVEIRERHSFDPRVWRQLLALVRERGFHLVHGHDYKADLLAWLLWRRTGTLPIATAHGWSGYSLRERYVYYPAHKRLLARFPRVVAVSPGVKRILVERGVDPSRITVILNGIDPHRFLRNPSRGSAVRRELGCVRGDVVIGAVGRLEQEKRFDLLLQAFAVARTDFPSLRLVIVGDGSLRAALTAQADRLSLVEAVRFLGQRDDVADLHQAFDLFVQTSEREGTPNAVLEAMAMETPIIATDAGGTSALAANGRDAIIVPVHDITAVGQAIRSVVSDRASAASRARAARLRVEQELSFDARTRKLEAVYDDVLAASRPLRTEKTVASGLPHA